MLSGIRTPSLCWAQKMKFISYSNLQYPVVCIWSFIFSNLVFWKLHNKLDTSRAQQCFNIVTIQSWWTGDSSTNLMCYVMDDKDRTSKFHQAIVSIVCLQIYRQQGCVPIVGDKDQIAISITDTPTWYVPWNLQSAGYQYIKAFIRVNHEELKPPHPSYQSSEAWSHLHSSLAEQYHSF